MKLAGWFKWFHGAINATNLAGAVDVVVVRHVDGTMHASPFYVRFGKLDVINSGGKEVYVLINGKLVNMRMILSEEGHAYFKDDADTSDLTVVEPDNNIGSTSNVVDDISFVGADDSNLVVAGSEDLTIKFDGQPNVSIVDENKFAELITKDPASRFKTTKQMGTTVSRRHRRLRPFMSPSKTRKLSEHYINSSITAQPDAKRYNWLSEPSPFSPTMANKAKTSATQKDICFECLNAMGRHECRDMHSPQEDVAIVRCQSDSDLDKRGITEEATYFLTRGRKAISDLGITFQHDEESDDVEESDDTKSWGTGYPEGLPSYILRPSSSISVELHSKCRDTFIPVDTLYEPFVFRIATIEQAVYYLHYMKCEVDKLPISQSSAPFKTDSADYHTYLDDSMPEKDVFWMSSTAKASSDQLPQDVCPPSGLYLGDALQKAADDQEISSLYHAIARLDLLNQYID